MTVDIKGLKEWAAAASIRAVKTMAQSAVAMIGVSVVMSDVNWPMVLSASVLSGVLSMLTSVAGIPEVEDGKSLVKIEDE